MASKDFVDRMQYAEILEEIGDGSARVATILGGSLLAEILNGVIRYNFVPIKTKDIEAIFEGTGPLSTFSARIRIAHAMGLLSEAATADLHGIRNLRNDYAHGLTKGISTEPRFTQRVQGLNALKALDATERNTTPTKLFAIAVERLSLYLAFQTRPPEIGLDAEFERKLAPLGISLAEIVKLRDRPNTFKKPA